MMVTGFRRTSWTLPAAEQTRRDESRRGWMRRNRLGRAEVVTAAQDGDLTGAPGAGISATTFSRRYGDPSRPWNHFSIDLRNRDGSDRLDFQGNWRDIFQNWEALAISYPQYIESFVSKFVNASTIDGYNPFRVSRAGFEWEILDPENPWSNIGYWGDHQVNYLVRLSNCPSVIPARSGVCSGGTFSSTPTCRTG
jgi:hypothetical protein